VPTKAYCEFHEAMIDFAASGYAAKFGLNQAQSDPEFLENEVERTDQIERADRLVDRLLFAAAIDTFQTYLSDLLLEIITKHPRCLSSKQIKAQWIFEEPDIDSLKRRLLEKHVVDLGYRNVPDLIDEIKENFGLDIAQGWLGALRLSVLFQIRNLITHNRGVINTIFQFRVHSHKSRIGTPVRVPTPLVVGRYLMRKAQWIDGAACTKFDLVGA
jgi:hypothetical protein